MTKNKKDKEERLLESAYKLFLKNGINSTTIQDIVDDAEVAKGTFYLYFKDKYELQEKLTIKLSAKLFHDALAHLNECKSVEFDKKIIFIVDYIINELIKEPDLIKFISKDLSLGYYGDKLSNLVENSEIGLYDVFINGIKENNIELKNPDVTLFMIIELISSTCFMSITKSFPLPIEEFKEYLYDMITHMIYAK